VQIGRIVAVGIAISSAGCVSARFDVPPSTNDEALYAKLYPYYAEYCAVSQVKKRPGLEPDTSGGIGGHAVLYLNGVCRDENADYPEIQVCAAGAEGHSNGMGISINAHFRNANWIAIPGRDFFFRGALRPNEPVTLSAYRRTQERARELGILKGVEYHDYVFDDMPAGMNRREFMYEISVATDYALELARDRYCARVPMRREQMGRVVAYLNRLNAKYRDGNGDYVWDVLLDNCIHPLHNALAAAGVWKEWPTHRFILISALDFPVPKNEFVNLVRRTNELPIDDSDRLYRDEVARRTLLQDGWLPNGVGSIVNAVSAVAANEIYDPGVKLIFYDAPVLGEYESWFRRIFSEVRYTDLRANLQHFADLYSRSVSQRLSTQAAAASQTAVPKPDDLAEFRDRLYRYIERQLSSTTDILANLTSFRTVSE
jgi:hypothetical protein